MTDKELNALLWAADADPRADYRRNRRIARALFKRERYFEAALVESRRPYAVEELPCGHVHVRACGYDFHTVFFASCWGAADDGESLDHSLAIEKAQRKNHGGSKES